MTPLAEMLALSSPRLWWSAGGLSVALLAVVLYQVDWALLAATLAAADRVLLLAALAVIGLEGVFTALRLRALVPGRPATATCFEVTAWHVVLLVTLPARLGEVAALLLMRRYLAQRAGPAIANLLVQRLFDVVVLSGACLLAVMVMGPVGEGGALTLAAAVVCAAVLLALSRLGFVLGVIATLTRRVRGARRGRVTRPLLRLLLQARSWYRRHLRGGAVWRVGLLTIGKWVCILGGFVLLARGLALGLSAAQGVAAAAAYNFLAVLPLQTVGGFGLGEAGLTGVLVVFGLPLGLAAGASVVMRLTLIAVPMGFWVLVMLFLQRARASTRPRL